MNEDPGRLRARFDTVTRMIGDHPETAFAEVVAHRTLTCWLAEHDFAIDTVPDLPTAFVARAGAGSPTLAVLLEYDALPEIGHACGHQLIGAGGALAAILSARELRRTGGRGTVLAIGCPAEESGAGKALLVEAGCFEGVDAAVMFHPASRTVLARSSLAGVAVGVEFHGRAAHAAKAPEEGRNALTALLLLMNAIDADRPRLGTWGRINGIITDGGRATNVIPDYARAEFMVRESTRDRVMGIVDRLRDMAAGAATSTGTRSIVDVRGPVYAERRNNRTLLRSLAGHLRSCGIAIDQPLVDESLGSSDVGNVSLVVPTIHPTVRITDTPVPSHTKEFAAVADRPAARDAAAAMASALAHLIVQAATEPGLLRQAREEFARGGFDAPGTDFHDL